MTPNTTLILIILSLVGASAFAQVGVKGPQDQRVSKLLDSAEVKYEIVGDGDFKVIARLDDGRTQLIIIPSNTHRLGSLEMREVLSVAHVNDDIDKQVLLKLLQRNASEEIGTWRVVAMGGKQVALISAKIPADIDRLSFLLILNMVAAAADDMEKALTGADLR